jgi:Tfp pilus assembly protein PilF
MKRHLSYTFLIGAGIGLVGCQSPMLSGLPGWGRGDSTASTAPDVSKQKFSGLASQFGSSQQPTTGLGGSRQTESTNFLTSSWQKTTAAISGAVATKPKALPPEDDPLRVDKMPKRIGPEVYVGAARLLENQGKFVEAEDKYREALKAAPTDLNGLVGLARLYDRQGQSQKALEAYQKAAHAHPNNGLVYNDLGLCLRRQQQAEKSVVAFRKAVELTPDNAKYRNNLAAALVDSGKENEAFAELAAVNQPAVAHYNLAYMLNEKGQRENAVRHLRNAVAADPSLKPAHDMLHHLGGANAVVMSSGQSPEIAAPPAVAPAIGYNVAPSSVGAYTIPQQAVPTTSDEPPSYHIGDDSQPAIQTAQRPTTSDSAIRQLPPVDE